MILPEIKISKEKYLVGLRQEMSFSDFRIGELWGRFAKGKDAIVNRVGNELISMAVYKQDHFSDFDPKNEFEKWAAVEVSDILNVPVGWESYRLAGGLHAVFYYKGLSTDNSIYHYIYGEWLPKSDFVLDDRPHFEVLGEKYKNNDPNSEEEIWIPVKGKY